MITHIIRKTDTLEGIAVRYNVPIAKIKKANKIYSKSVLMCMEKILIPEEDDILSPNTPSSSKGNQPGIYKYIYKNLLYYYYYYFFFS